ncbi:hypothetical protein MERGE_002152 [Pneumocystis wakefieldiae]|uniref:RFTS domain-containing protein n=1 Tax=Pneumocystis wakefieldiae TaxID=38082 RepID=A0A899G0I1_9ASCO|nr:hypothetical protein MERGE_002152 [Pneumocystis wakefieldiae]
MNENALINENPVIYERNEKSLKTWTNFFEEIREKKEESDEKEDIIDKREIYDLLANIMDPEHPLTLEQLAVVNLDDIYLEKDQANKITYLTVEITPTIPHCSMATLIGLCIRVRLERCLPPRFRISICQISYIMREDQAFRYLKPETIDDLPQCELAYKDEPEDIFDAVEKGPFVVTGVIRIIKDEQSQYKYNSEKIVFIKLMNVYLYKIERLSDNSLLIWIIGQRALYIIQSVCDEYKEIYNIVTEKADLYSDLRTIRESETKECNFAFHEYLEQISYVWEEEKSKIRDKIIKYSKFLFFMMLDDTLLDWPKSLFFKDLVELCGDSFELAKLNKKKVEILRNNAIDILGLTNGFSNTSMENHDQKLNNFQLQNNFFNINFSLRKSQNNTLTYPFPRTNAEGRKLYNDLKKALMHVSFKPKNLDIDMAAVFLGNDLNSVNDMKEKIKSHAEGLVDLIRMSKKWEKSHLFKQLNNITKGIDIPLNRTKSRLSKDENKRKLSYNRRNRKIYNIPFKKIDKKISLFHLVDNSSSEGNSDTTFQANIHPKKEFLQKITNQLISELINSQKYAKRYNLKIFIHNVTNIFKISYKTTLKFILENIECIIGLITQKHTEIYKDLENMLIFKSEFLNNFETKPLNDRKQKDSSYSYNSLKSNISNSIENSSFKNKNESSKKSIITDNTYGSLDTKVPLESNTTSTENKISDSINNLYESSNIELNIQKFDSALINLRKTEKRLKNAISHNIYKSSFNADSTFNNKKENEKKIYDNNAKPNTMNISSSDTSLKNKPLCNNIINTPDNDTKFHDLDEISKKSLISSKKNIINSSNSDKNHDKNIYFNKKDESNDPVINNSPAFNQFTKSLFELNLIEPGRGKPMLQIIQLPSIQPSQNSKVWFCPLKNCNYFLEKLAPNKYFKAIIKHLKYHKDSFSSKYRHENLNEPQSNMVRNFVEKLETIAESWKP